MRRPGMSAQDAHGARRVSFLVDHSMYDDASGAPGSVYADLDKVVRPDLHYHYSGPVCAQRWLDVCDDPAYGHRTLVSAVAEGCPDLAATLRADRSGLSRVSLISLGPGDGSLDETILRGVGGELKVESYAGFDFSFELLRRAVHRIARADGLRQGFPIKAVCGDFTRLGPSVLPPAKGCARIFALTGLTIGNYREDALLGQLRAMMRPGDYLFLDARLHELGPRPSVQPAPLDARRILCSYDIGTVRRFVFGPVEVATMTASEDAAIGFEVSRAVTAVPSALNVVIFCTDLDTRMRLTGRHVHRDRLDLAVTTMYHGPDLAAWFPSMGFTVEWHRDGGAIALYLLQCI